MPLFSSFCDCVDLLVSYMMNSGLLKLLKDAGVRWLATSKLFFDALSFGKWLRVGRVGAATAVDHNPDEGKEHEDGSHNDGNDHTSCEDLLLIVCLFIRSRVV